MKKLFLFLFIFTVMGVAKAQVTVTCPNCYGSGNTGICNLCGGRKYVTTMYGTTICYNCAGSGYAICPTCGGRGAVVKPQINPEDNYGYNTCHICRGSGTCTSCNGNGYYSNPFGSGYIKCPNCMRDNYGNNTGKCSTCRGTGKVYGVKL